MRETPKFYDVPGSFKKCDKPQLSKLSIRASFGNLFLLSQYG